MSENVNRPYLLIQNDWNENLIHEEGRVWVTCKVSGQPGTRGVLEKSAGNNIVVASEGFSGALCNGYLKVMHENPNCGCCFYAPQNSFSGIHMKSILSMDVTSGRLGVSSSVENKLIVWDTERGIARRELNGHVGDVYSCRFFPSGIVILSGGADMQLKIWSAETGQCPVTLTGHTGAILDTAIIERGRNIISVSRDGTAKLWDCGQSVCLATIADARAAINGCAVNPVASDISLGASKVTNEREIGTEGKLLLMACEDKFLRAVAVQSRDEIFSFLTNHAVNACSFLSTSQVVCGTNGGQIYIIDIRNPRLPVNTWVHSAAAVNSILPFNNSFFVTYGDGLCQLTSRSSEETKQLTGPDCDPVYKIVSDNTCLYTCCRDGVLRKYKTDF